VDWESVFATFSVVEAAIIAARLEDEGIPTHTHQETSGMAYGLSAGLMGQIDVLVPDSMVEQALAIVEDLMASEEPEGSSDQEETGEAEDDEDSEEPPHPEAGRPWLIFKALVLLALVTSPMIAVMVWMLRLIGIALEEPTPTVERIDTDGI
jgi:hypothetical protein